MKVTSLPIATPRENRGWFKKITLGVLGLGSVAGVTAGYLHLDNRIDNLGTQNTILTQRLGEAETAKTNLTNELAKASATIARLEQGMSQHSEEIVRHKESIGKNKEELIGVRQDVIAQGTKITELVTKDSEHDKRVAKLDENLGAVTVKVGNLEKEVSVSELQDVYKKGLASAVLLEVEIKHKEKKKDDKGNEIEVEESHTHNGSGYIVAHINGGKQGGYISTNWHVLECEKLKEEDYRNLEIIIHLPNGKKVKAKPHLVKDNKRGERIARGKTNDHLLLKTTEDISDTTPVAFASSEPQTGEAVMVIGGPFSSALGYRFSGSFGIVSGDSVVEFGNGSPTIHTTSADAKASGIKETIVTARTDAAMNPGNSGGYALRVKDGKLVFMPTFIYPGEIFHGIWSNSTYNCR